MKKFSLLLFVPLIILSCNINSDKSSFTEIISNNQLENNNSLRESQNDSLSSPYNSPVLSIDDVLVNGQKILMSKESFNFTYNQIDSTIVESRECGNPFEWLDKEWMTKIYGEYNDQIGTFKNFNSHISVFYSRHASFDSNNHLYLLNTAYADKNVVNIPSNNIKLTNQTSLAEFERLFPKAEKEILKDSKQVRFRLFTESEYDNSLLFYFENDRFIYVNLWWLLC
jgi:hypothetical protein